MALKPCPNQPAEGLQRVRGDFKPCPSSWICEDLGCQYVARDAVRAHIATLQSELDKVKAESANEIEALKLDAQCGREVIDAVREARARLTGGNATFVIDDIRALEDALMLSTAREQAMREALEAMYHAFRMYVGHECDPSQDELDAIKLARAALSPAAAERPPLPSDKTQGDE